MWYSPSAIGHASFHPPPVSMALNTGEAPISFCDEMRNVTGGFGGPPLLLSPGMSRPAWEPEPESVLPQLPGLRNGANASPEDRSVKTTFSVGGIYVVVAHFLLTGWG